MYDPSKGYALTTRACLVYLSNPIHWHESKFLPIGTAARLLMNEVHDRNVAAGWWTDITTGARLKRNVGELLMLVVSEISESMQAYYSGAMDDKLPAHPGDAVEIADALIRLLDIAGGLSTWDDHFQNEVAVLLTDPEPNGAALGLHSSLPFERSMMQAVIYLADAMEANRKSKPMMVHIAKTFMILLMTGQSQRLNIPAILPEKMYFNAHREDHKIENRLKKDGKKY